MAHNLKGYDGQFIVSCFSKMGMTPTSMITNGSKITYMEYELPRTARKKKVEKIVFKDSFNFIPMALSKFSKTFGLSEEKGYFPYLFNTQEHENYVGPWPDAKFYHPETMNAKQTNDFDAWYAEQGGKIFDMEKEMKKYCVADVDLLRKGCLTFRRIFHSMNDVDPFAEAMTIAQACQKVFRKCFLQEETIAAVPHLGYDNHSLKALKWLAWIGHRDNISIRHARNGGKTTVA